MTRLLLADDEPLVLENLLTMMPWKEMGCTVVDTAEDGEEALDKITRQDIDILISDIRMPGMGGLELFAALQEMDAPPVLIALTGYDEFEYAQRALRLGIFDYILKPIDYGYLREAVAKAIDQRVMRKSVSIDPLIADIKKVVAGDNRSIGAPLSAAAYRVLLTWSAELLTGLEEGELGSTLLAEKEHVSQLFYIEPESGISLFLLCFDTLPLDPFCTLHVAHELSIYLRLEAALVPSRLFADPAELAGAYQATKEELDHIRQEGRSWLQAWRRDERHALVAHRVGKLIEREYHRELVVSEVAEFLGVSVSYLSESVRELFNATFVELLTSVRLRHAREALAQTEASVAQIATMVGYRDYRYFARVFRDRLGTTPSEYRKRRRSA